MDIENALNALETLASSTSTSSSGPLNSLIDQHFQVARERLTAGSDPKQVIQELQKNVTRAKKDVEKGLKTWYAALGNVGKAVEKAFPPNLAGISSAYDDPPLFSEQESQKAMDRVILHSLGRRGMWQSVSALESEADLSFDPDRKRLSEELHGIIAEIEAGDVTTALAWCKENETFLKSPPHPSSLPYYLHRSVFLRMTDPSEALAYARQHLMRFLPTQPVLQLLTSCLYPATKYAPPLPPPAPATEDVTMDGDPSKGEATAPEGDAVQIEHADADEEMALDPSTEAGLAGPEGQIRVEVSEVPPHTALVADGNREDADDILRSPYAHEIHPLVSMFRAEYCRRHGWSKEDPLGVVVDLGSRGGALNVIEKARRVMGEHLGNVRQWEELPMEVPLPPSRRYHSVFVCPVSKEQATEDNPPKMLTCGHVIAEESLGRMLKGGRRMVKCPYCPAETGQAATLRLYF